MVSPRLALACALGVLLALPQAATAGGWWSHVHVDRSHVAPGERVEVEATTAFGSAEEARDPGEFYVYLLRGFDDSDVERAMREPSPRNWWSLGDAEAIRVGRVTVSVVDANLGRASAAFTLPELPPATYHLMLCDAGCARPLADVIPTPGFTVVADAVTARHVPAAGERRSAPGGAGWAYVAGPLIGGLALLALRRGWSRRRRRRAPRVASPACSTTSRSPSRTSTPPSASTGPS